MRAHSSREGMRRYPVVDDDALRGGAATIEDEPASELVPCGVCADAAIARCPRCDTAYCASHGGAVCDACSDPATGLPPPRIGQVAAAVFALSVLLALALLVLPPPRLRGERQPAASAPTVTADDAAAGQAPVTPAPSTPPATERYVVKAGDTLGQIAARYGTTLDALAAANPGIDPVALQIGQELTVPAVAR